MSIRTLYFDVRFSKCTGRSLNFGEMTILKRIILFVFAVLISYLHLLQTECNIFLVHTQQKFWLDHENYHKRPKILCSPCCSLPFRMTSTSILSFFFLFTNFLLICLGGSIFSYFPFFHIFTALLLFSSLFPVSLLYSSFFLSLFNIFLLI